MHAKTQTQTRHRHASSSAAPGLPGFAPVVVTAPGRVRFWSPWRRASIAAKAGVSTRTVEPRYRFNWQSLAASITYGSIEAVREFRRSRPSREAQGAMKIGDGPRPHFIRRVGREGRTRLGAFSDVHS